MTPTTVQRTSFKKHRGTDARPIMDGEFPDIKNNSGRRIVQGVIQYTISGKASRVINITFFLGKVSGD
jgi:hypothetical protein